MLLYESENNQFRKGTLRLFLESHMDLTMCVLLSIISWYEVKDWDELTEFMQGGGNILNNSLAIIFTFCIIIFPIWLYKRIKQNFNKL